MRKQRTIVQVVTVLLFGNCGHAEVPVQMFGEPGTIKEVHRLSGHKGEVTDAIYLPDGGLLTAGVDGTLRLWDVAAGRDVQVIAREEQPITKLMLAYDQRQVISFSAGGDIAVWQLPTPKRGWGPEQAVGAPDSEAGDRSTAWASETEDGQPEWLLLEYAEALKPKSVRVHENCNPGAVVEVIGIDVERKETSLWKASAESPRPESKGLVVELPVTTSVAVNRLKLVVDSPKVGGWNEIDAVGLVDESGEVHWARRAAASSTYAERTSSRTQQVRLTPAPVYTIPDGAQRLTHVDDSAEGKQSYGGSGDAIMFEREDDANLLVAIELFGSRYGMPQPPDENFRVYLLDEKQQVIRELEFPYAMFERGAERWVVLGVDGIEIPKKFGVALNFNAHQTKGVYLGKDESVKASHSLVGAPAKGFEPVSEKFDWMVRVHLAKGGGEE